MKPLVLWLVVSIVLVLSGCHSARPFDIRTDIPRLASPPGVVWLRDSLFIDEAEVANIHYLEYLFYVQRDSGVAFYRSQLPDTIALIQEVNGWRDPYVQHYLRYPGFRFYPAVGISYDQAVSYCRWRSAKVNEKLANPLDRHFRQERRRNARFGYTYTVEYRLPTITEWEEAAADEWPRLSDGYCPGDKQRKKRPPAICPIDSLQRRRLIQHGVQPHPSDQLARLSYTLRETEWLTFSRKAVPVLPEEWPLWVVSMDTMVGVTGYVYGYHYNPQGLFCTIGNAAEMTATPGIAKGGSFQHTLAESEPSRSQAYSGPCGWLGFRPVCVVHVRPLPPKASRKQKQRGPATADPRRK